jgi:hypothetical protein
MKRVVSVSLGSSQGNKSSEVTFAGVLFHLERIGTDGDVSKAAQLVAHYDGQVDAIGLGGADRYLVAAGRKYEWREPARIAKAAKITPVVDGGGIKRIVEPMVIRRLVENGVLEVAGKRVLLMSAVDRPGMAEVFPALGAKMVYGDLLYAAGVPIALTSLWQIAILGRMLLPFICRRPISVQYPTGKQQESSKRRSPKHFREADIVAGDFHLMHRYMPEDMRGKVIVTQTTRAADVEDLRRRGVAKLITTTPPIGGESFATNVMEGVFVVLSGKRPEEMTEQDYVHWVERIGWEPGVTEL